MLIKTVNSAYGHTVDISHSISKTRDNLHVVEITALCGGLTETSRVTIGAVDGIRPKPPTKDELQKMLDTHRQRVADEASWKERVRENIDGLE